MQIFANCDWKTWFSMQEIFGRGIFQGAYPWFYGELSCAAYILSVRENCTFTFLKFRI